MECPLWIPVIPVIIVARVLAHGLAEVVIVRALIGLLLLVLMVVISSSTAAASAVPRVAAASSVAAHPSCVPATPTRIRIGPRPVVVRGLLIVVVQR